MIVITIPAYDEGKTIYDVIADIDKNVKDQLENYMILVVNDGSDDNTTEEARRAGAIVYEHKRNFGLAKTFQTEIDQALKQGADIIVHTDADGQYDSKQIIDLINEVKNGTDLVIGSRFDGMIENMPFIKKLGNKMFSKVVSLITHLNISDAQSGFRAFTKEVAETIKITSSYTYTQEQIIKASKQNFRIKQIPINFFKRGDKSRLMKNAFDYAFKAGINIIRTFRDYEPLKFFGFLGLIFIIPGLILGTILSYWFITLGHINHKIPTAILCVMLLLIGLQICIFGLLADMKR